MQTGYEYLLEHFPEYDYRRPLQPERVVYQRPDNITGHQQRAFNVWWAVERCGKTGGIGLELGSGGVHTPWCLSTDAYATDDHPVYGGSCKPHMAVSAHSRLPFEDNSFSLVLANHVVEHLPGDVPAILRDWVRVLKPGGVMGMILPDQAHGDVLAMDRDHKHAWTANQFLGLVGHVHDVATVHEHDSLANNFSFNTVLVKR